MTAAWDGPTRPAPVPSADSSDRPQVEEEGRELRANPQSRHRLWLRWFYWALGAPPAPSGVAATAMATLLLPERLSLPPLESFYLQGLQEGWEQGEDLIFGLEFTSFSFYFPEVELGQVLPWGLSAVPVGSQGHLRGWGAWATVDVGEAVGANASAAPRDRPWNPSPAALGSGGGSTAPGPLPLAPTSMMFSRSTLEATLNSGVLWRYRPSVT